MGQLGGSDHKPVLIFLDLHCKQQEAKTFPRWNYKRANWERFSELTEQYAMGVCHKHHHLNRKVKDLKQATLKVHTKPFFGDPERIIDLTGQRSSSSWKITPQKPEKQSKKKPQKKTT